MGSGERERERSRSLMVSIRFFVLKVVRRWNRVDALQSVEQRHIRLSVYRSHQCHSRRNHEGHFGVHILAIKKLFVNRYTEMNPQNLLPRDFLLTVGGSILPPSLCSTVAIALIFSHLNTHLPPVLLDLVVIKLKKLYTVINPRTVTSFEQSCRSLSSILAIPDPYLQLPLRIASLSLKRCAIPLPLATFIVVPLKPSQLQLQPNNDPKRNNKPRRNRWKYS